jgi:hypothetical protein
MQTGLYKGVGEALSDISKKEGFWGFYNAYGTTVMREVKVHLYVDIYAPPPPPPLRAHSPLNCILASFSLSSRFRSP